MTQRFTARGVVGATPCALVGVFRDIPSTRRTIHGVCLLRGMSERLVGPVKAWRRHVRYAALGPVGRLRTEAADLAGHVQLAALLVRHVLEPALPINVPRTNVRRIHRQPNPLKPEFVGQVDATPHQFGADAEILKTRTHDDQHFALVHVDGESRQWPTRAASADCAVT